MDSNNAADNWYNSQPGELLSQKQLKVVYKFAVLMSEIFQSGRDFGHEFDVPHIGRLHHILNTLHIYSPSSISNCSCLLRISLIFAS